MSSPDCRYFLIRHIWSTERHPSDRRGREEMRACHALRITSRYRSYQLQVPRCCDSKIYNRPPSVVIHTHKGCSVATLTSNESTKMYATAMSIRTWWVCLFHPLRRQWVHMGDHGTEVDVIFGAYDGVLWAAYRHLHHHQKRRCLKVQIVL